MTVDTQPPTEPVITVPESEGGLNSDEVADGVPVNVVLPADVEPGDVITVTVTDGTTTTEIPYVVLDTDVPGDEIIITIPPEALSPDGDFEITVGTEDEVGNKSTISDPIIVKVDTITPSLPVFTIPESDNGGLNAAEISDSVDVNITLPSDSKTGDTITLMVTNGISTTTFPYVVKATDNAGSIVVTTVPITALSPDGDFDFSLTTEDTAGNVSSTGDVVTVKVDSIAPGENEGAGDTDILPVITFDEASDGFINKVELADVVDGKTLPIDINLPPGTEVGSIVTVTIKQPNGAPDLVLTSEVTQENLDANNLCIDLAGDGGLPVNTPDGDYEVELTVSDVVGNISQVSLPINFTIDTEVGSQIADLHDDSDLFYISVVWGVATKVGSEFDNIVAIALPRFFGEATGEPGTTVNYYVYATLNLFVQGNSELYEFENQPYAKTDDHFQLFKETSPTEENYTKDNPYLLSSAVVDSDGNWKSATPERLLNDKALETLPDSGGQFPYSRSSYMLNVYTEVVDAAGNVSVKSETLVILYDISTELVEEAAADPLILDLNGDGQLTLNIESGVEFDIDADGEKNKTGWVAAEDGLLVRDVNGDGQINDGSELFGDQTIKSDGTKAADGFDALNDLDSNNDGVFNAQDDAYSELNVWQDKNSDGVVQDGELLTLSQASVKEISLATELDLTFDNGNFVGIKGKYTDNDGLEHAIADVWLEYTKNIDVDQLSTVIIGLDDVEILATDEAETFVWNANDTGENIITDFDINNDSLDLSDLLVGEYSENLSGYLNFSFDGDNTTITITKDGEADSMLTIVLDGIDLSEEYGTEDKKTIINRLLNDGDGPLIIGESAATVEKNPMTDFDEYNDHII